MKRMILLAFIRAFAITVGFSLICFLYGFVSGNPFEISLKMESSLFLLIIITEIIEYLWKNRKRKIT